MRYAIVIEVAASASLAESEQAIREAIAFHPQGLRADNLPIPRPASTVDYVEVAAQKPAARPAVRTQDPPLVA